jgi:hypothetical protein
MGDPAGSRPAPWVSLAHSAHSIQTMLPPGAGPSTPNHLHRTRVLSTWVCPIMSLSPQPQAASWCHSPPPPSSQVPGLWTLLPGHFSLTTLEPGLALSACPLEQGTAPAPRCPQFGLLLGSVGLAQPSRYRQAPPAIREPHTVSTWGQDFTLVQHLLAFFFFFSNFKLSKKKKYVC